MAHRALTQGYWWPKMVKESEAYVQRCERCQKNALLIHQPGNELKMINSPWPFAVWGLDIVGKMPKAKGGYKYMITATDLYTKWVEAAPILHIAADDVARFLWKYIISRLGVPYAILSDNGTQFVAKAIKKLYREHNITMKCFSVAYPQGNGQAEATNKTITRGLKKRLEKRLGAWVEHLPHVLWAYRTTPGRATGRTPFSMAYGMEAVLPLARKIPNARLRAFVPSNNEALIRAEADLIEELREDAHLRHAAYQKEVAKGYNKHVKERCFQVGDLVLRAFVQEKDKTKLKDTWEGPYYIAEKVGHGAYKLAEMNGELIDNPWNT